MTADTFLSTEPTNYQNYAIDVDGSGMRGTKVLTSVTKD
jgi:hypothetical protein